MGGRSRGSASRLTRGTQHERHGEDLDLLGRERLRLDDLDLREHEISPAEPAPGELRDGLLAALVGDPGVPDVTSGLRSHGETTEVPT
jgi:hypothetical protein